MIFHVIVLNWSVLPCTVFDLSQHNYRYQTGGKSKSTRLDCIRFVIDFPSTIEIFLNIQRLTGLGGQQPSETNYADFPEVKWSDGEESRKPQS